MRETFKAAAWHKMSDREKLFHLKEGCNVEYNTGDVGASFHATYTTAVADYVGLFDKDFARKYLILL